MIVITTQPTVQSAVKAIRSGAYEYLSKPLDISRLEILLRNAVDHLRATNHLHELETANADGLFGDMVGTSEGMQRVFHTIELSAPTDVPILLLGETGIGKELVARAVRGSRELPRYIGTTLISERMVVGRVEVGDKPEILWERPDLERLYSRLQDECEISERHIALERKLSLVTRTAHTALEVFQDRRSLRVEWYIVILIVLEILLSLDEMFLRPR